jgi:hypothetical protein
LSIGSTHSLETTRRPFVSTGNSDQPFFSILLESVATEEFLKKKKLGIGENLFLTGLFRPHKGVGRNIPIVRTGNIAALREEKVNTSGLSH